MHREKLKQKGNVDISFLRGCLFGGIWILDRFIINVTNYAGIDDMLSHVHGSQEPIYRVVIAIIFGALVVFSIGKKVVKKVKSK